MTHPPSPTSRHRLLALLVPLALVGAACGQKAGVAGSDEAADGGVTPPTAIVTLAPTTLPPASTAPTAPPASTPAGSTPGGVDTTALAPATTAAPVVTTAPVPVGPFEPGGDDTAGVSDTEIVIGIHAPVTGASPIPQTSFDVGKDIYWQWLAGSAPDELFGRKVRVVFRDDQFNPAGRRPGVPGDGRAGRRVPARRWRRRRPDHGLRPVRRRQRHPVPVGRRQRERPHRPRHVLRHDVDLRRAGADADRPDHGRRPHRDRPRRHRHTVVRRRPGGHQGRGRRGRRHDRLRDPHQQDGGGGRSSCRSCRS